MLAQTPAEIPFEQVIAALLDADTPLNVRFLYRLSDLEGEELDEFKAVWARVPDWRRLAMMEDIEDLNENDMLLSFETVARFALTDEDSRVRVVATRTLWDYQDESLIPLFLDMLRTDPESDVRAAAASALGRYVYAGELEEIPEDDLHQVEDALLTAYNGGDDIEVRRAALEALGYSSREDISSLIEKAYASDDKFWKASALFAMGRSANERWKPQIMAMLESNLPLLRLEAARAAGEVELHEAVPLLIELLDDVDENTRQASIWSLSQLGGQGVMDRLTHMYEAADEADAELLESAIDNLAFTEGIPLMPMLDLAENKEGGGDDDEDYASDDDDEGWYEEYDLEEMDEEELFEDEDEFDEDDIDEDMVD